MTAMSTIPAQVRILGRVAGSALPAPSGGYGGTGKGWIRASHALAGRYAGSAALHSGREYYTCEGGRI